MSNYGGWPGQPGRPGPGSWAYAPPPPKPGVIPLHPLTVADIISGIFATLRHYFWAVYGPLAIAVLASGVVASGAVALSYSPVHTLYTHIQDQGNATDGQVNEIIAFAGGFVLLYAVCTFLWYAISALITSAVLRHAVVGRRATMRQILAEARPRLRQTLGALGAIVLAVGGALLVSIVACIVLGALAGGGGVAIGVLLILASVVWLFFLTIRMALLVPVVVLESQGVKDALARAWRLNQGNWWRTLGFTMLVSLLGSVASQVVTTPISMLTSSSALGALPQPGQGWSVADLPSFGSFWLYFVGTLAATFVTSVLLLPLVPLSNGLLYIDRRIRRESLDEQLAAEAGINLATPPPPPPGFGGGWPGQAPYRPPYGHAPYGQPPYGQAPYGGWPGQQPPTPPAPPVPPAPEAPTAPPQDRTGDTESPN